MVSQRQPLAELPQAPSGTKVRRTYGKKHRILGRTQLDRDIFLIDEDLGNAFQGLALKHTLTSTPDIFIHNDEPEEVEKPENELISSQQIREKCTVPEEREIPLVVNDSDGTRLKFQADQIKQDVLSSDEQELNEITKLSEHKIVQSFDEYGNKVAEVYDVEKIGEGAYSSVFLLTKRKPEERPDLPNGRTIIKLIPLQLSSQATNEETTKVSHVANEIRTLKTMDQVHGFIRYRGVVIVQGAWPAAFLDSFRRFKRRYLKRAENPDPEELFPQDQYYALVEMQDAGNELDTFIGRPSAFQMYDIFWMTTIYLAMAEELVEFEHRDLHSSNICIKPMGPTDRVDVTKDFVTNMERKPAAMLGLTNMSLTLIDYTLSRAKFDADGKDCGVHSIDRVGEDTDNPAADERYEEKIQRLTYAKTSKCVTAVHEKSENQTESVWEAFSPKTNVCWLAYLLGVLFNRCGKQQKTKYKQGSNTLAKEVQDEIRASLSEVRSIVDNEDIEALPGSASELLGLAVSKSWLSKEEIDLFKRRLEQDS